MFWVAQTGSKAFSTGLSVCFVILQVFLVGCFCVGLAAGTYMMMYWYTIPVHSHEFPVYFQFRSVLGRCGCVCVSVWLCVCVCVCVCVCMFCVLAWLISFR